MRDNNWTLADPFWLPGMVRGPLRGLIRVVCPLKAGPQVPDLVDRIEQQTRVHMAYMNPFVAIGLCLIFVLMNLSPLWRLRSWRTLASLSVTDRQRAVAILADLQRSHSFLLLQMMLAVRGTLLTAYYDQPEVHNALGYHPIPWIRDRIAHRRQLVEVTP